MPVEVFWDNEGKTIIRYQFTSKWTWEEAYQAMSQAVTMTLEQPHIVDALIDFRQTSVMPSGAITQLRATRNLKPENRGVFVIVTTNPIFNTLPSILRALLPHALADYHVVPTLEKAYELLNKLRQQSV